MLELGGEGVIVGCKERVLGFRDGFWVSWEGALCESEVEDGCWALR